MYPWTDTSNLGLGSRALPPPAFRASSTVTAETALTAFSLLSAASRATFLGVQRISLLAWSPAPLALGVTFFGSGLAACLPFLAGAAVAPWALGATVLVEATVFWVLAIGLVL